MDFTNTNGLDVALVALVVALLFATRYAVLRMRRSKPRESERPFDFWLAPDLAEQRRARELRKASAYREHYFGEG